MGTGMPEYFNRYSYVANDPVNAWDPSGLCSSEAGQLQDCPDVIEYEDGVLLQGAEFNGLETNFVGADSMETLNKVVGVVDQATQTEAGQAILVGGQDHNDDRQINLAVNSGQTNPLDGSGTYTSNGSSVGSSFVDTSDIKPVSIQGKFVTHRGIATVAEKVVHELVHATNPAATEKQTQGLSNFIHKERGSRQILHGNHGN